MQPFKYLVPIQIGIALQCKVQTLILIFRNTFHDSPMLFKIGNSPSDYVINY